MVKSCGWGGMGCPSDYCVSPSPNYWVFGIFRLCLNLGSGFRPSWDRGLGTWTRACHPPKIFNMPFSESRFYDIRQNITALHILIMRSYIRKTTASKLVAENQNKVMRLVLLNQTTERRSKFMIIK